MNDQKLFWLTTEVFAGSVIERVWGGSVNDQKKAIIVNDLRAGRWPFDEVPSLSASDLSKLAVSHAATIRPVTVGAKEALDMSFRLLAEALERGVIAVDTRYLKENG